MVNAPDDIGTLLVDSLLVAHGISSNQVKFNNAVPFPAVGQALESNAINAAFSPEPFVSLDEETLGIQELADLDQGYPGVPGPGLCGHPSVGAEKPPTP